MPDTSGWKEEDDEPEEGEGEDAWEFVHDPTFHNRDDPVLTQGGLYGTELVCLPWSRLSSIESKGVHDQAWRLLGALY